MTNTAQWEGYVWNFPTRRSPPVPPGGDIHNGFIAVPRIVSLFRESMSDFK